MSAKGRLAIGIVTHFPNQDTLDRISMCKAQGLPLYLYDNTPNDSIKKQAVVTDLNSKGQNNGIGVALYTLTQKAYEDGWEYFLYFDQDVIFSHDTISWIEQWLTHYQPTEKDGLIWFNYKDFGVKDPSMVLPQPIKVAISAGSLFRLSAAKEIGWHTTTWFMEGVDYDFCLRLAQNGFNLLEVKHCPGIDYISHQQGLYRQNKAGKVELVRIQPLKRIVVFTGCLLNLFWRSIQRPPRVYAYVFFRNIFTFWYDQVHGIFWTLWLTVKKTK